MKYKLELGTDILKCNDPLVPASPFYRSACTEPGRCLVMYVVDVFFFRDIHCLIEL